MGVFFAIRLKLTDEPGAVDNLSGAFQENYEQTNVLGDASEATASGSTDSGDKDLSKLEQQIADLNNQKNHKMQFLCSLEALSYSAPKNVMQIIAAHKKTKSDFIANQMMFAVRTHLRELTTFEDDVEKCKNSFDNTTVNEDTISARLQSVNSQSVFEWTESKVWDDAKQSIAKDAQVINRAAAVAEIEPRLIVSSLMVEQLRLFYSQRELYKKYFEPLKILANANKISLGVMAIKEETAANIESHLKDPTSDFYLGPKYEHLLDYPEGADKAAERYNRLSSNNHYYNYLYGALYLKQFLAQWQKAGYDLTRRPEILTTLFNVGFMQSKPGPNPKVGGSTVTIGETKYSFGRLGYEFYYSTELTDVFPFVNNL